MVLNVYMIEDEKSSVLLCSQGKFQQFLECDTETVIYISLRCYFAVEI